MALGFVKKEMESKMLQWDEQEHLPKDVLSILGQNGFGGKRHTHTHTHTHT